MPAKLVDIAFLMGSGRVNWDVEIAVYAVMGADSARSWTSAVRAGVTDSQLSEMHRLVKATPAGQCLA